MPSCTWVANRNRILKLALGSKTINPWSLSVIMARGLTPGITTESSTYLKSWIRWRKEQELGLLLRKELLKCMGEKFGWSPRGRDKVQSFASPFPIGAIHNLTVSFGRFSSHVLSEYDHARSNLTKPNFCTSLHLEAECNGRRCTHASRVLCNCDKRSQLNWSHR